jgi:hypothetical protein
VGVAAAPPLTRAPAVAAYFGVFYAVANRSSAC